MMFIKIKILVGTLLLLALSNVALAGGNDNPLLTMLMVEEFEWREGDVLVWDAEAWIGKDYDKIWLKTEGETSSDSTEEFEVQALYNRSISPFWNLQAGWRGDFQPVTPRNWLAIGVSGLVPGFIRTELTGFARDGHAAARLKARYHLFLSQRWLLVPRLETNWYSDEDPANGIGDGLADLELGLRLHYRIKPNLTPYLGLSWTGLYGGTADFVEADGGSSSELQALVGLSLWF
jgi:copper resistance protein B